MRDSEISVVVASTQALGKTVTGDRVSPGTIDAMRAVFAARYDPWRLTEITLENTSDQDLAIVSWADEASAVLRGRPTRQHIVEPNES
jgi:hypothetical protein